MEVNFATLRGDTAASTLFGHVRGAFTGAQRDRPGLLRSADGGLRFLDEIDELGADEQAMLLRALEEKRFLPVGADQEAKSDFQLIAGINRGMRCQKVVIKRHFLRWQHPQTSAACYDICYDFGHFEVTRFIYILLNERDIPEGRIEFPT